MKILIKNATLVEKGNPLNNSILDIEVVDGKITKLEKKCKADSETTVIEKENLHVSVGWIDTQVVFGEPGFETTETIENGLFTAAKSGFTEVCIHSNTLPAIDNQSVVQLILNKAANSATKAHIIGSFTKKSEGIDLAELFDMKNAGAIAFGDYKKNIDNTNLLKIGLQYCSDFDGLLMVQPMNKELKGKGFVNEGINATQLGLKGIPAMAEEIELEKILSVLEYTSGKIHIPCVSTKKSVEIIANAKKKGLKVTCGVSVNNLVLTDDVLHTFDSHTKIYPPLRTEEDRLALVEAVKNDTIDVITTDHCPVNIENKRLEYDLADYGSLGLESAFGALQNILPTDVIIDKLTSSRTKVFGAENQTIKVGEKANLTLFNPTKDWIFEKEHILSFSKNSIMLNTKMKGEVYGIINQNKIVI
jgi:dihydroorotase